MKQYDRTEFSKIYKRVLEVELNLKNQMFFVFKTIYGDKMFYRLIPYLKNLKHNKYIKKVNKKKRDKIQDIINSNKSAEEKLHDFLDIAYISDVLNILTEHKLVYTNKLFIEHFYNTNIDINIIKGHCANMISLRNCIMHFKFNQYYDNKIKYLKSLSFWERLLDCSLSFVHELPNIKPTTTNILKLIKDNYPDTYTENDRLVADVFDDIAFINGVSISKLPKYWTIGRQWYKIKK